MEVSIRESNSWGADLHLPIHTNAGGGAGTVVFVYEQSEENLKPARAIYQEVQAVTPGQTLYGVRTLSQLAELNSTNAIAVYLEVDFHDNAQIAKWLTEHPQTVGEAIAKGICKNYGVPYQAPGGSLTPAGKKTVYRIQVGAFADRTNAEAFLKKVQAAGFSDAFLTQAVI